MYRFSGTIEYYLGCCSSSVHCITALLSFVGLFTLPLTMGLAATVYAELLYRQGHGHPLWYPEPSEGLDGCVHEIHLGDVGYLDESGGFRRLFNITVPAEHELNKGGVPDSFTPVTFNPALRRRREKALDPGELCSEGVERVRIDGTFGA